MIAAVSNSNMQLTEARSRDNTVGLKQKQNLALQLQKVSEAEDVVS